MPAEPELLRAESVTKHFGLGPLWSRRKLHAVDDVDLNIGPGKIVALVGESGSGKSTLVRLLAMLSRPTSGEIYFEGRGFVGVRRRSAQLHYRRKVRMVFQDPFSVSNPAYRISHSLLVPPSSTAPTYVPPSGAPRSSGYWMRSAIIPASE